MTYNVFCGGVFETNCYLLEAPKGWILFDAPDGACDWLQSRQIDLKLLLLTHGHIDHVQDVAKVKRTLQLPDRVSRGNRADDFGSGFLPELRL